MDRRVDMTVPSTTRCFTTFTVVLMLFSQVTGNLVVAPVNRVAAVGQRVQFDCSTNLNFSVLWHHFPLGSSMPIDVYISRKVVWPYHPRFTIQRKELANNVTAYNLVITDVRIEDAGKYRCVDRTGMGEQREAELTVLGYLPNCTTNIGADGFICENDCRHLIEEIRTSCSIEYAGNIAPEMQWKTTSGQDTIQPQPNMTVSEKTVSSELNITATKSMDGALLIWYSPQSTQMKWTSAPVKILYAKQNLTSLILSQSQIVTCSANSSQHCSYTWIVKMDTGESQTIERQTLEVNQPGTYLCHAHCPLHQRPCTVIALHVEYKNGDEYNKNLLLPLVIGFFVLLVVVVVAIFIWKLNKAPDPPPSSKKNGSLRSTADKLCPCLRKTSDNSPPSIKGLPSSTSPSDDVSLLKLNSNVMSPSSNNDSSQSRSDEIEPCMKVKSNGICNSSAPSPV